MNVPQEVMEHKTLMVALLSCAAEVARELDVDGQLPVAGLARSLGANRTAAYQQRHRLVAALTGLVASGPGRPAGPRRDPETPGVEALALRARMLEFRTRHLDAVLEYDKRSSYSPAFQRFILGALDGWAGTTADFAAASDVPADTLKDWVRDDAAGPAKPDAHRPKVAIPVDASETTRSMLKMFDKWQGSTRAFLKVAGERFGHRPETVRRVLRICGAIQPRRRRAFGYRGSTARLSPGAMLVTDGKTVDILLTHTGRRLQRNWQGIVDQATGCDTAVVVTHEEDSAAAILAFERSVTFLGGEPPEGLLHDNKPCYESEELRTHVERSGTVLVAATPGRAENKAVVESDYSRFEARVGTIRLDDRSLEDLTESAVSEVVRAYTAATNGVPRIALGGLSRVAALRRVCRSAEQREADRAFIRRLKERHDGLRRRTWRDNMRPASRRLLDKAFATLRLEDRDPSGKLRDYLSTYDPAAIRQAAAIVATRLDRGHLDRDHAHRYLAKVIQARQESIDLESEEKVLLDLCRQSAQDWVSVERAEYDQLKRHCSSCDLACALAERAAQSHVPVGAAFWTERLLEHLGESRHLLGSVRRFLVRLYEAPADRRLSLLDRLAALECGVT